MPLVYDSIIIENRLDVDVNGHIVGTNKGDLIVDDGTKSSVLNVGSNSQVLIADSTSSVGVKWGLLTNSGLSSGIDAAKIADGSVSNTTFQRIKNLTSDAVGVSDVQTLTNKKFGDFLDMNGNKIVNLATPVNSTDAVNKSYVDSVASGLDLKESVRVATNESLDANSSVKSITYTSTGGSSTRGSFAGVLNTTNVFTVDGVDLTSSNNGSRILVKNQTTPSQNGIYTVTISGTALTLNRAGDFDNESKVTSGAFMFVESGVICGDCGWVLTSDNPLVIGGASGSSLTFTQFTSTGQINAGTGMVKNGPTLNVVGSNTILANADNLEVNSSAVANQILLSSGSVGTASVFGALPLNSSNSVTGILPVSNGGTGVSSFAAGDKIVTTNVANNGLASTSLSASQLVTLTDTQTLTNKTLTGPKINGNLYDTNNNEVVRLVSVANAVNDVSISNAATAGTPSISASGDDTNINLNINAKGTGKVVLSGLKYPNVDGTSDQVLKTDGAGNLSFVDAPVFVSNTVSTTTATATVLSTITTTAGKLYTIEAKVVARNADGTSGVGFVLKGVFSNVSGTITNLGNEKSKAKSSGNTWDANLVISGSSIQVQVTGQASTTVSWKGTTQVLYI